MQCKNCLEHIVDGAKKCRHCDTYQSFWQYMIFSSKLIGLASGFSALVILFIPIAKDNLGLSDSDFVYSYVDHTDNSISFFISNTGERAGTIGSFAIPLSREIRLRPVGYDGQGIMLEAGESVLINLVPKIDSTFLAVELLANEYEVSADQIRDYIRSVGLSEETFSKAYYLYSRLGDKPLDYLDKVDSIVELFGCMLVARTVSFRGESRTIHLLNSYDDKISGPCNLFVGLLYSRKSWTFFKMIIETLD